MRWPSRRGPGAAATPARCAEALAAPVTTYQFPTAAGGGEQAPFCDIVADGGDTRDRVAVWQQVLARVERRDPLPDPADASGTGVVLRFPSDADLAATLGRLAVAEYRCCSFGSYTIVVDGTGLRLEIRMPVEAADTMAASSAVPTPSRGLGGVLTMPAWQDRTAHRRGRRAGRRQHPDPALLRTPRPARRAASARIGGHRLYPPDTVALLNVIKAAQRLGFTLDEVAELLDTGRRRHPTPDLRQRAIDKIAEIDAKIADLTAIRDHADRGRRRPLRQPHQLHLRRLPDPVPDHRHHRPDGDTA